MRPSHRIALTMLVAALAAYAPPAAASAQTTTTVMHLRAHNAGAEWITTAGCIRSDVVVFLGTNVTRTTPGPPVSEQFGVVALLQENGCTGQTLVSGVGSVAPPQAWRVAPSLGSAALRMDGTLVNTVDGRLLPLHVDVTWTATAAPTTDVHHNVFHAPGLLFVAFDLGIDRKAAASGTVTVGSTTNLAIGTPFAADIVFAFSGDITVTHT